MSMVHTARGPVEPSSPGVYRHVQESRRPLAGKGAELRRPDIDELRRPDIDELRRRSANPAWTELVLAGR